MDVRESTVERRFCDVVENMGGVAVKLKDRRDWPDRIVLLPGGVHFFAELKRSGEKPTRGQLRCHTMLRRLGHKVMVYDGEQSKSQLLLLICQWVKLGTSGLS